jgi:hypothetical protein
VFNPLIGDKPRMARTPTESRIFADRYFREARRIEALHAGHIAPGTTTWRNALDKLFDRMENADGPIKRAAILKPAITYLRGIADADALHIVFGDHDASKRSAALVFATFSAGRHPLGLDEEGLRVLQHVVSCTRHGATLLADVALAYVSKHAMARLHERDYRLTAGVAFDVFGFLGILGLLARHSDQHERGGLCLRHGDILAVGSVKAYPDGRFLDIRTVLPADEVRDQALLDQGAIAHAVVTDWLAERDPRQAKELAARIPCLPRREDDFTLRSAVNA